MNSRQKKSLIILKNFRLKLARIRQGLLADQKKQEATFEEKQTAALRAKIKNL